MTTVTKEWLQQTIAEFENARDDIPFGLDEDDAKILKVLKQALASMDAVPVMYAMAGKTIDIEATSTCKSVVDSWVEEWNLSGDIEYKTVPLYTTPLALAPMEAEPIAFDSRKSFGSWMLKTHWPARDFRMGPFLYGQDYADSYTRHMWKAWSACHTAMLTHDVTLTNEGNNDATPPQGA